MMEIKNSIQTANKGFVVEGCEFVECVAYSASTGRNSKHDRLLTPTNDPQTASTSRVCRRRSGVSPESEMRKAHPLVELPAYEPGDKVVIARNGIYEEAEVIPLVQKK